MIAEISASLICLRKAFVFPWRKARGRATPSTVTKTQVHKLPQDPILVRLLASSHHHQAKSSEAIIHDVTYGFQKNYLELLEDILQTAHRARTALPPSMLDERGILRESSSPYIGILVRSGYEFIVAFLAIRTMGGACMPIASGILPEEAHFMVSKSKSMFLFAGEGCQEKAESICKFAEAQGDNLSWAPISSDTKKPHKDHTNISVEIGDAQLDPSGPGVLLFTSGTTGRPKGVVLPRSHPSFPDRTKGGVVLTYRAGHWIAGTQGLIGPVLSGKTLHILQANASAEELLDAMMRYRPTQMLFTPTLLRQMKTLVLAKGGPPEQYAAGFQGMSAIRCSSAPIEPSLREFWTRLTGLPFENIYGATETGGAVCRALSRPNGSIGTPLPGNELKLSEGHCGEILVKTRAMFTHYIGDEEKTRAAFDKDGFYKTGDMAELKDGEYFFAGRAATDYISFRFFQIPALVVEASLMDLPYVADACVLGVPYHEARQLCGAVIQLRHDCTEEVVNLAKIRADLAGVIAAYMLPVVLRVLKEGEQLPRTDSGKPIKRRILSEFLGTTEWFPAENLPDSVEYFGCALPVMDEKTAGAWDWAGMQVAQ
ncbi:hypothetical protein MFIFM68171_08856 [Madurella fahalii]|uniref:Uncharacterized protein n=1 Tax=Madurella fahalii TaxID=1157608 RepID=A0ABQ0GLM4_9PEZI